MHQITVFQRTRELVENGGRDPVCLLHTRLRRVFSATLVCIAILAPTNSVHAQNLQLNIEAGLLSGAQIGQSGTETVVQRQRTSLAFDLGAVLDDETVEWSLGILMQLEAPISIAAYPKVRLVRSNQHDAIYAHIGIPWYLVPFRRFGVGLGGGYRHKVGDGFYVFSQGSTEFYFAGGDIPDGQSIIAFSLSAGGRITF